MKLHYWAVMLLLPFSCVVLGGGAQEPEEGGFGGTGHRPEALERPEMPERVDPLERPEVAAPDALDILDSVSDPVRPQLPEPMPEPMPESMPGNGAGGG